MSTLHIAREVIYLKQLFSFVYINPCVLIHSMKCVSYDGSNSKEVQKPWCRNPDFPHVRVERNNVTTSYYARIKPPEYIEKHNCFVGLICLYLSETGHL